MVELVSLCSSLWDLTDLTFRFSVWIVFLHSIACIHSFTHALIYTTDCRLLITHAVVRFYYLFILLDLFASWLGWCISFFCHDHVDGFATVSCQWSHKGGVKCSWQVVFKEKNKRSTSCFSVEWYYHLLKSKWLIARTLNVVLLIWLKCLCYGKSRVLPTTWWTKLN